MKEPASTVVGHVALDRVTSRVLLDVIASTLLSSGDHAIARDASVVDIVFRRLGGGGGGGGRLTFSFQLSRFFLSERAELEVVLGAKGEAGIESSSP